MVTASTSPRWAPLTRRGPVSGWMRFRLGAATSAGVVSRLNGLSKASRVSKVTMSPGLASMTGSIPGCQRLWHVPSGSSAHFTGTLLTRVVGILRFFANDGPATAASNAAARNAAFFMGPPGRPAPATGPDEATRRDRLFAAHFPGSELVLRLANCQSAGAGTFSDSVRGRTGAGREGEHSGWRSFLWRAHRPHGSHAGECR